MEARDLAASRTNPSANVASTEAARSDVALGSPAHRNAALGGILDLVGAELGKPLAALRDGLNARLIETAATASCSAAQPINALIEQCDGLASLTRDYRALMQTIERRAPLRLRAQALRPIVADLETRHRTAASARNHDWRCQFAGNDTSAETDVEHFQTILDHLVENAIRFTAPGGRIRVDAHSDARAWTVSVSDNGPGMKPEFVSEAFQPFRRSASACCGNRTGNGLGLPLCDALARHLSGSLVLESVEGRGTTAHVTLPLRASSSVRQ
jgi:signal transduction histidine kinase